MKLEGRFLGILGFGKSGKALKKLADKLGIKTFVSDLREGDERENTYRILMCDIVSPSPGIPPHNFILSRVERSKIPIIPEIEIGWRFLRGKTVAITGTNGKSTTAYFTHKLIKGSHIGGNWGYPHPS
jgi:UDP-N-acetylmuramoylalanine-D-glutamate ligase